MAGEADAVGVVDDAMEDRVGVVGSPISSCHLSTGTWLVTMRPSAVAFFEDFEEIVAGGGI
jgi:hypothetical protein